MEMKNLLPRTWQRESDPWRELGRLQRRMNRLFEEFTPMEPFWEPFRGMREVLSYEPPCDIQETDSHYLVSMEIPGVKKEDIDIEVKDNQLSISGERKREKTEEQGRAYTHERYFGEFHRVFTLPSTVKADQVKANYESGILEIAIPKVAAGRGKQVKIEEKPESLFKKVTEKGKKEKAGKKAA